VFGALTSLLLALLFLDSLMALAPMQLQTKDVVFLLINLALCPFIALLLAFYRLKEQAGHYFIVSVLQAGSQTLFSIVLLNQGYGTTGVMFSGLISTVMIGVCFVFPVLRQIGFSKTEFKFSQLKQKLSFSAFITASSLCLYAANGLEHWFIASSYTASQLAYYFVAAQLTLIGSFMFEPVRMWWYAKRYRLVADDPTKYQDLVVFCLSIALTICVVLSVFIPVVINALLPIDYHQSNALVPVLIMALAFRFKAELLNVGCYLQKDAAVAFWINFVIGISSIVLLMFFSTTYGLLGIAYIVMIVQAARFALFYGVSQHLLALNYPLKLIAPIWALLVGTLIANNTLVSGFTSLLCLLYLMAYASKLGITGLFLAHRVGETK
jgi:O-antigen/teichoic acid export membrane protein